MYDRPRCKLRVQDVLPLCPGYLDAWLDLASLQADPFPSYHDSLWVPVAARLFRGKRPLVASLRPFICPAEPSEDIKAPTPNSTISQRMRHVIPVHKFPVRPEANVCDWHRTGGNLVLLQYFTSNRNIVDLGALDLKLV